MKECKPELGFVQWISVLDSRINLTKIVSTVLMGNSPYFDVDLGSCVG